MGASIPGWYPDPIDASLRRWWDGDQWTPHVSRDGETWALPLGQVAPVKRRRRMPTWAWVVLGVLAFALALALSPLVAAVALVVLITGIVALAKGTPTWLRLRSKRAAGVVTAVSAAAFLVFGGVAAAVQPDGSGTQLDAARFADSDSFTSGRDTESERATTSSPTPTLTPTPTPVTTVEEEIVTESVAFEETTIDDADLPKGQTQVTTPGRAGERTLTYRVTVVDGVETERELVSDVVTTEPVTQVTAVGTYVEPPPPPAPEPEPAQPSGCDPNYADACVPISSDVDCAGGSGNGPAYFDGIARVVGSDIYQLDRDGDGFACEPN